MSKIYTKMVQEMLERMTDEEKEEACKELMKVLGIEEKEHVLDKHCPYCGGELVIDEEIDDRTKIVHCKKCGRGGMCGYREDEEDLPTEGTLAYGRKLDEAMKAMAEEMDKAFRRMLNDCDCSPEPCEEEEDDEDDDDKYSRPDYEYKPKKKCSEKCENKKKVPPLEDLINFMKSIGDMIEND